MGWTEDLNYVLFKNPVSSTIFESVKGLAKATSTIIPSNSSSVKKLPPELENLKVKNLVYSGHPFVRLAGISGAAAVILGAYGSHSQNLKEGNDEKKRIYLTANNYHFLHSLALIGVPLSRHPQITGSFLTLGILLFCGTCYYEALSGKSNFRKLTPVGGTCLIFAWLSFLL